MIAPNHLVRHAIEAAQKLRRGLVTQGRAGIQLGGHGGVVIAVLGLAQIAERHEGDVAVGLAGGSQDGKEVGAAGLVVVELSGIDVQISDYAEGEGRGVVPVLVVVGIVVIGGTIRAIDFSVAVDRRLLAAGGGGGEGHPPPIDGEGVGARSGQRAALQEGSKYEEYEG